MQDSLRVRMLQQRLFDWRPDKLRGERSKHENVVIIKNLFEPGMFNKEVTLILEYQQDLREECLKCGDVRRVIIYDRHSEGVAQVTFKEPEAADACVQLLNGRWFGQRQITAETWDGKTKYKISETDEEIKARMQKWEKFLGAEENTKKETSEKNENSESIETSEKKKNCESVETSEKKENSESVETSEKRENSESIVSLDENTAIQNVSDSVVERDSDQDTRSSVGSDYDTDDDVKASKEQLDLLGGE